MKYGKGDKAIVASNIMYYIVGQYPRFRKAHWKFLRTVVNELFEFMRESHEALQPSESEPFIKEIVRNLQHITCDLTRQQIHTFYKACGHMVAAQSNKHQQESLLAELMPTANAAWDDIIRAATQGPGILEDSETIKIIGNIMKTNVSACSSIGGYFGPQIGRIYMDMLEMYRATSLLISEAVARAIAPRTPKVRGSRAIKKEILKLIETYVEKVVDLRAVRAQMVPPLLDPVLVNYNRNVPGARGAEVLRAMSVELMEDQFPIIMQNVLECTLEMINKDFCEFPEHRVGLFNLLRAISRHCFPALLELNNRQLKSEYGPEARYEHRQKTYAQTATAFFQQFFSTILDHVFFALCDPDHKAGFETQSMLPMRMLCLVHPADGTTPKIQGPVYSDGTPSSISNKTISLTTSFRHHVRDFLISLKEFADDDVELYVVEKDQEDRNNLAAKHERTSKVGGLLKPSDIGDEEI
ncbi:armadillo-type protein [Microdochium trichocladiopsis]|uniref:Armadillo-type protein n=1 Tax=Microdochium trichocladiopsis TaxID=1682393 RepID=A0A9P8XSU3_9PEZI|nr:armadillo-type protein [Microdochium trichocladiopsis]KAH7016111.1 armadillo-type protein [Microdochium trichocladiopsis]